MLAEHRQLVVEVQEIAEETGWQGPKAHGTILSTNSHITSAKRLYRGLGENDGL